MSTAFPQSAKRLIRIYQSYSTSSVYIFPIVETKGLLVNVTEKMKRLYKRVAHFFACSRLPLTTEGAPLLRSWQGREDRTLRFAGCEF
jgi:hypothetical protein